jgi:hypothetical protein
MRGMKHLITLAAALGLGAVTEEAFAQRIGMFFDPEANTCSRQIGLYEEGTIWIIAFFEDQSVPVVGAQFGIYGFPRTWSYGLGGPSGFQGFFGGVESKGELAILAYEQPLSRSGNAITLGWIQYFSASVVPATTLRLEAGRGSNYDTPILIQREDGSGCAGVSTFRYFVTPATGSRAVINGECSTSVESKSWDRIKSLYR